MAKRNNSDSRMMLQKGSFSNTQYLFSSIAFISCQSCVKCYPKIWVHSNEQPYHHRVHLTGDMSSTDKCYEGKQSNFQFSSVGQSCPTLCDPMNRSTPGLPLHHQLPESTQTHVHCVGDAMQPSHPLSSPSPPALNLSQHQGLFK